MQVLGSAKNQLAFKALLYKSFHCTKEELVHFRNILQAMLMAFASTSNDGGHRHGRLRAQPLGFYAGPPPNVIVVSKALEIAYCEMLYICNALGFEKFNKRLQAHGLLGSGDFAQTKSPLEPDWVCNGVPAAGKYLAEPCCAKEGSNSYTCMVGTYLGKRHPFYGIFLCNCCHRPLERREACKLEELDEAGKLDSQDQERLGLALRRKEEHRACAKRKRQDDIAKLGRKEAKLQALAENRLQQDNKSVAHAKDPKIHSEYKSKAKGVHQKGLKNGNKPKKSGIHRESKSKKLKYPVYFKEICEKALQLLIDTSGTETFYWNNIVELFDTILVKEKDRLEEEHGITVELLEDGRPNKYPDLIYRALARTLLEKPPGSQKWQVRDYVEGSSAGKKKLPSREQRPLARMQMVDSCSTLYERFMTKRLTWILHFATIMTRTIAYEISSYTKSFLFYPAFAGSPAQL